MNKEFIENGLYDPQFEKDNCGVGFITNRNRMKTHQLIKDGLEMLSNMAHRGAVGYDDKTGDGAGIKIQIPKNFFKNKVKELKGFERFGVGQIFLPMIPDIRFKCMAIVEEVVNSHSVEFIKWRNVPIDENYAGTYARSTLPEIQQLFIDPKDLSKDEFKRKLYLIRKEIEKKVFEIDSEYTKDFYFCSLSEENIIYKGLLLAKQIGKFYKDLKSSKFKTSYIIVHQRYSTNTSPSWRLAHPFRYIAHNGEINTINGNIRKFESKKEKLQSKYFNDKLMSLNNIIEKGVSDSANLDNIVELLRLNGRNILKSLGMVIPEPWENNKELSEKAINFYRYHSKVIEPWDGPATLIFSDDEYIGAKLDRNGLRPARYYVTKKQVILASEAGVVKTDSKKVISRGKIKPGQFFAVSLKNGEIKRHQDILESITEKNYKKVMEANKLSIKPASKVNTINDKTLLTKQKVFGYSIEELQKVIAPMCNNGKEPITSMGTDTPLAILSKKPKLIFDYFKQLFAQVTNPAIDPIREENVMSLKTTLGQFNGLLDGLKKDKETKFIEIDHPVITNKEMKAYKNLENNHFRSIEIPLIFDSDHLGEGLQRGLDLICERVQKSINNDYNLIILSDRSSGQFKSPIPSLLALGAVNNYLLKNHLKSKVDIIVETADARNPMHMALLFGYGASLVNPYLALDSIKKLVNKSMYIDIKDYKKAEVNFINAIEKGILKILSKMGISTLNSYIESQIFEIIGLNQEIVDKYFNSTPSRVNGVGLEILAKEVHLRHKSAYFGEKELDIGSELHFTKGGEKHLFTPEVIANLQQSCRKKDYSLYKQYANLIDNQKDNLITLRGLFKVDSDRESISLNEVEPIESIMKRFVTGAMSFGSLSKEAHENLALAMNSIGAKSNSGEGGEDEARFYTDKKSKIKQIAAGRFGVTLEYLNDAEEIQIKISQGAKPGEGGHLPGKKVVGKVAEVRRAIPNLPLISPPPHHDIYSIEDLEQLIYDLKSVNPKARISVKLVSRAGIGTIASGVAKGHADMILISGHDGGTGAAPISSVKYAGVPWEIGLSETHQSLLMNNLRDRVSLQVDGQMRTGRDVLIATLLGAEEYGFATAPLVVSGCVMLRKCHSNKCPMGVATQDPELRRRFKGKPEHVINYFKFIATEVREYLASLGYRNLDQLIGRSDLLSRDSKVNHWKIESIDLSEILYKPSLPQSFGSRFKGENYKIAYGVLDDQILRDLKNDKSLKYKIKNTDRTVGAKLSHKIVQRDSKKFNYPVNVKFNGTAGQSFGAFLQSDITFKLIGDANDYVAKGLSGGKIIIKKPKGNTDENLLVGNTALYGATRGRLYINGDAGERFAVRNSGAIAVVEGLGNHGCEYMTNGIVVVLGTVGNNFGAGMSGGVSFIFNKKVNTLDKVNKDMVTVKKPSKEDLSILKGLIQDFYNLTNSKKAKDILKDWNYYKNLFAKVSNPKYDNIIKNKELNILSSIEVN